MPKTSSVGFCRVNLRRPCLICGKPDWCSYTANEKISICMRVCEGARKINRSGGAIHVHDRDENPTRLAPCTQVRLAEDFPRSPLAPIEIRDFVYSTLIRLSPAANYFECLIAGEKGLLARGFSKHHLDHYGGLPGAFQERDQIVRRLLKIGKDQSQLLNSLLGVPGFWEDARGTHLWKPVDHRAPRLLIPVRDEQGRIQACQMRCHGVRKKTLRYCWLSSLGLPYGTGSGSPLHFTFTPLDLSDDEFIVIVEGSLKADVLLAMRPDLHIVATAGVSANHEALIELTRGRRVLIAFDQDYHGNATVCLRLASLVFERWQSERTLVTTRIAVWDRSAKGIDDAVLRKLPITSVSAQRWFSQLSQDFRHKTAAVLNLRQK